MTAHRVHGMGEGLEAPTWPAITRAEAAALLARLPEAGRLEALTWHSPRPFSSAALAQTDTGVLFLKRHDRAVRDAASLGAEHAFIAHLAAGGVPVAAVLADAGGRTAWDDGRWVWEVHRAGQGLDLYRDRASWTPFLSADHAHAAGVALARLHRAGQGFDAPARTPGPLVSGASILTAADPLGAAEALVAHSPALADYLADKPWRHDLGVVLDTWQACDAAQVLRAAPSLWTHNDWHPSNLLWDAQGDVACVLDFGLADRGRAMLDLAIALERSAVRWLELGRSAPIAQCADALALLAGYETIAPVDRALVARLLPLCHVEFALAEVDYFHGVLGHRADADLAWQGYLLDHAAWFAGAEGSALLGAIRQD